MEIMYNKRDFEEFLEEACEKFEETLNFLENEDVRMCPLPVSEWIEIFNKILTSKKNSDQFICECVMSSMEKKLSQE